jgi:uncharacterized repeat protein (TIGR03806 family)
MKYHLGFIIGRFTVISVALATLSQLCPEAKAQTLRLRFAFEDSGTTTTDSAAGVPLKLVNGSTATDLHGTAGSGVAGIGKALDFSSGTYNNATSPIAFATNSGALNFGPISNFTLTQWIKPGVVSQYPRFFEIGPNTFTVETAANSFGYLLNNGPGFQVFLNGVQQLTTGTVPGLSAGSWSFIAITYDGSTLNLYAGSETSPVALVTSAPVSGQTINLGASGTVFLGNRLSDQLRAFQGLLDDTRFYTGAADVNFLESVRRSALSDPYAGPTTISPAATAILGSNVTISAIADGTPPITYRWFFTNTNGVTSLVSGATTGTFTLTNVQYANAGNYFLVVSNNPAGTPKVFTNTPATLTVTAEVPPVMLVDLGINAPTPGINDAVQFSTAGQANQPDGLNYYTDNQVSYGSGEPGQTFFTPDGSAGFLLTSLAFKTGGGTSSGTGTPQGYLLHIYSVSNGAATVLAAYSATNFTFADGDWLQWTNLDLSLMPNSAYGYSFGKVSAAVGGWDQLGNASGNPYPNGELGIFPVAGGNITFASSHDYDGVFDVGLTSLGPPSPATVANKPATTIQGTAATLNGTIVASGGSLPYVTIYYGATDGGTNAAAWSNNVALGAQLGDFSTMVTGLTTNTTYYYTAQASNTAGISWAAPASSFTTAATVNPPTVTNLPATLVGATTVTLNGQVLDTGNEWPIITIYYGTTDGGANPAAWSNHISLPAQGGVFNLQVAGLSEGTTYYFAAYASNSAGSSWGGLSQSFTTLAVKHIPVLTYHYDNTRQGLNPNETLLTPANVNTASFGKLFTYPVDGYVYAQPLIMTNLTIPGKGTHNVLFVLTMHDTVYAFDADSNGGADGGLLWKTNVGISAVSPSTEYGLRYHAQGNTDVVPEEGMVGTPVIDAATGTLYLDAFTREVVPGVSTNYYHRIHALDVTTGNERPYGPVVVAGSVPGTGVNGSGGVSGAGTGATITDGGPTVTFSAIQHCARPALTLAGGVLYVAYGSHDDTDPYHGWVFGYNPANLALLSIYCTSPNATLSAFGSHAGEGAIWMSGNGLCADVSNNLYFMTGNGAFSQNTNGGDYGDSFVKLSTAANQLSATDYFTPYNQASLQSSDADLGSGGAMLLPDAAGSAAHPHLIVGAGKQGKIYLVDRDNMGHYQAGSDSQIVQSIGGAVGGCWCSPAYFNNWIYYQGNGDVMKAFFITNGSIATTPVSKSTTSFGFPGQTPTISADGSSNGIAWVIDASAYLSSGPAVLHAYNATNLADELYNSSQNPSRDYPGAGVKMVPPVIAGGKVYVGAQYAVSVFGNAVFLTAPTISPNGGPFTNSVMVTLSDTTAGASIFYTLDGTTPTTDSTPYTGPFALTSNALVQAIAAAPGAVNSAVTSASFNNTAASGIGTGLQAEYFANHTSAAPFTGSPALVQTNATVNFNWGTIGPASSVGATNFTVRWTGCVQPQFSESYTFTTTADDGVRLYVNGQLLIDDWTDKAGATTRSNSIALTAQQLYNIELDYYQKTNNASVTLSWNSPSTPNGVVPQTQLYPYSNPAPAVVLTAPAGSSSYTAPASVTISADADAPYNPVSFVSFYANGEYLGSVSNAPYTLTTTGLAAGSCALTAVAVDGSGLSSTSAVVNISVGAGSGQPYGLTSRLPMNAFLNLPTTAAGSMPALLSQVGIFSNTPGMTPVTALIPYTPNTPLWSDGALKTRYFAVPNNGGTITPDEQIGFAPTGSWSFPAGTVFVKTFELNTDTTNPNVKRRLETRLLVRDINGQVYGVTYKWRADNSDADLLPGSLNEDILITNATGVTTQTWYYPSRSDCLTCHTPVANYVLGVSTRQLNGNETYPSTGVTDNQLRTLNRLGLLNPAFDEQIITNLARMAALTNLSASLETRARSYLDANCVQCHQPGGIGPTFDARFDTPLASQNIINGGLDSDGFAMVVPKDIWRSEIHQRMDTTNNTIKMPPLARNLIDTNAVQVLTDWINSLPGVPALAPPVLTPNGGNFVASVNVAAQQPDANAVIYYTLDGSKPTTNSLLYTGPFTLLDSATVSASSFRTGYVNSVTTSALFMVEPLHFVAEELTNNVFRLTFSGTAGGNYVLEATTNLVTWTPIATNMPDTNVFDLFDPATTNYPYRFYRVRRQ